MITIFCTPKNFEGIFDTIQKNAIRSWRQLSKDIEIIIFGNSKGAKEISIEVEGVYYPEVKCSKNGVPLLSDLFYKANKIASFDILLFINSDILLPQNIIELAQKDALNLEKMINKTKLFSKRKRLTKIGDKIVVTAGLPLKKPGTTNLIRVVKVD